MSKQKWKAWFITTLVLFTIVRVVESCRELKANKMNIESEEMETTAPQVKKALKAGKIIIKKTDNTQLKSDQSESDIKKSSKRTVIKNRDKSAVFKERSEKVYFKVENGLALVGSDMLIGQVKDPDSENGQFNIFEKEVNKTNLWPSANIPYGITENISTSMSNKIKEAINYLNQNTSLNLYPIDTNYDEDAIVFEKREDAPCSSYVGKIGGLQPIFVNQEKCGKQEVLHEILHALGFVHEQQRENRDERLQVLWENIKEGQDHNFAILPDSLIHPYSGSVFEIDFSSVMMYPDEAFSKRAGLKTIKALNKTVIAPQSKGISKRDIERINYLYGT